MVRYRKALLVSLVAFATMGIAVANADAPTITGFPNQINQVDLSGYVIQTSYPLGANTGFTFQQTYGATTVSAHAVPDNGQRFVSNYVAMPVGNKMLMVTWYLDERHDHGRIRHELPDGHRFRCRSAPEHACRAWSAESGHGEGPRKGPGPDSSSVSSNSARSLRSGRHITRGRPERSVGSTHAAA